MTKPKPLQAARIAQKQYASAIETGEGLRTVRAVTFLEAHNQGFTYQQIADEVGLTIGAVQNAIKVAKRPPLG